MLITSIFNNNISFQPGLQLVWDSEYSTLPADDISALIYDFVIESGVLKVIGLNLAPSRRYNPISMLTVILLGYTERGYISTRQLQHFCRHDSRCRSLLCGQVPSHTAFSNFINNHLKDCIEEIFKLLNLYIQAKADPDLSALFIDGSKFEADANKFTFVWRKAAEKNLNKLYEKAYKEFREINRLLGGPHVLPGYSSCTIPTPKEILHVCSFLSEKMAEQNQCFVYGKGRRKSPYQRHYDALYAIALKMYKYESYLDLMGDRNSLSKTDSDATFMHMKYDYYCNTGVFKPGYNVQLGVSDQFIRVVYVSGDPNDQKPFIPTVEAYHDLYNHYPQNICADAGYSSFDNYTYLQEKQIGNYIKPQYWMKRKSGSKKDRFKTYNFVEDEQGVLRCPEGHEMEFIRKSGSLKTNGRYEKILGYYGGTKCAECPSKNMCSPKKDRRIISVRDGAAKVEREITRNLETEVGREYRKQRSIQAEGAFGQIKEDFRYTRLHRIGAENVNLEIHLVCIGYNFRKLYSRLNQDIEEDLIFSA